MANYHKEFLVPYLKDVSALHLALNKLENRLGALDQQKVSLDAGIRFAEVPRKPLYEAANGVFLLGCGIYGFLLSIMMFANGVGLLGWLCVLCGIMGTTLGILRYVLVSRENSRKEEQHSQILAEYLQIQRENKRHQNTLSDIAKEMQECRTEIASLKDTLSRVYAAKIIPEPLQNIDAAVFLYVWFATDRPDDLQTALKVFVHEDIKEKLDRIIANRTESFLKPYLRSSGRQQDSAAAMRRKLRQMEVSDDDRDAYLAMLDSNIATAAYFATAKYLAQI